MWNGAGLDELATNGANWVGGVAPNGGADIAQFDATSSKDCTWDVLNGNFDKYDVQATYLGTITLTINPGNLFGTFAGGTIDLNGVSTTLSTTTFSGSTVYMRAGTATGATIAASVHIMIILYAPALHIYTLMDL